MVSAEPRSYVQKPVNLVDQQASVIIPMGTGNSRPDDLDA